jgi:hypothetical protein
MPPGSLFEGTISEASRERMRLNGWEFVDLVENGECLLSATIKGPEIHVLVAPEWRGRIMTRRRIRAFLGPLHARNGYLSTRIGHDRVQQRAFVERLGFKKTWVDPMFQYYELTTLPFERKAK